MSAEPVGTAKRLSFDDGPGWRLSVLSDAPRPVPEAVHSLVLEHYSLGSRYMHLVVEAPHLAATATPGQFVMITVAPSDSPVPALPRPMAIYETDQHRGTITIVYALVGSGTQRLSHVPIGERLLVVGPLGRGFEVAPGSEPVLLIGRGIGTCSLTTVAQHNARVGMETIAVTSGRDRDSLVGGDFYRAQGAMAVYEVTDEEGTSQPDALFAALTGDWDHRPPQLLLTCGSNRLALLCQRLAERWDSTVQISLEAHMACGIGYCHGCASGARSTTAETPLVCKDGPVFELGRSSVTG